MQLRLCQNIVYDMKPFAEWANLHIIVIGTHFVFVAAVDTFMFTLHNNGQNRSIRFLVTNIEKYFRNISLLLIE